MLRNELSLLTTCCLVGLLLGQSGFATETPAPGVTLLSVERIWDRAPHNAFVGLTRFQNRWYCAFREGTTHNKSPGKLRVLVSSDGSKWTSTALIAPGKADFEDAHANSVDGIVDLRDANLSVTPRDELMLVGLACTKRSQGVWRQTMAWFSKTGRDWSQPVAIGDANYWLWKVVWHQGTAYSAGYSCGNHDGVRLYRSEDGRRFKTLAKNILPNWAPPDIGSGETSLVFSDQGTCFCVVRRDRKPVQALLGRAEPLYTQWQWKRLDKRVGGPMLVRLPGKRLYLGTRLYDGGSRTSLCRLDSDAGRLEEVLRLPSGGDSSYPGIVLHDGVLWIAYYSSHEGNTNIYLAKVSIEPAKEYRSPYSR